MKKQRVQKDKIKLKKELQRREMTLFKINIIYKVIMFKTEYYWHRLGSVEQWTLKRDS